VHRLLGRPLLSSYVRAANLPSPGAAYLLLEHIGPETERLLSATRTQGRTDPGKLARLYQGMARIMVSLTRFPQPRIGSFTFNARDGTIALANRPLKCTAMTLEKSETPRTIRPNQMY
jgi:hypothetical protein